MHRQMPRIFKIRIEANYAEVYISCHTLQRALHTGDGSDLKLSVLRLTCCGALSLEGSIPWSRSGPFEFTTIIIHSSNQDHTILNSRYYTYRRDITVWNQAKRYFLLGCFINPDWTRFNELH